MPEKGFIKELCYKAAGRLSLAGDIIRPLLVGGKNSGEAAPGSGRLDKTGILVDRAAALDVAFNDGEVVFAMYASLAHSLWRAQELSLFLKHSGLLKPPVLDFGCGDGSFASVLFKSIDYGFDIDAEALDIARGYGLYRRLLDPRGFSALEEGSAGSVFSNSVLEHVEGLPEMLRGINRVLTPGGVFVFTVVLPQFETDAAKYIGTKRSRELNHAYYHRNILGVPEWEGLLNRCGFTVTEKIQYQPDWFTFWYLFLRLFGRRGLGFFIPNANLRLFKSYRARFIGMVRESINNTGSGANAFIVARKR